jgi:hypothetical protein
MSRAPNAIQSIIDLPIPHPRDLLLKTSKEFQEYRRRLWDLFHIEGAHPPSAP